MRKLITTALVAASLLAVSAPALAGWYDYYGIYHCYWVPVWTGYGWLNQCY